MQKKANSKTGYVLAGLAGMSLGAAAVWGILHQSPSSLPVADQVVLATVNDQVISKHQFIAEMELRGGRLPGQYQTIEQRRALLDVMVERQAMLQAATAAGFDKDPVIQRQLDNMIIQKLTQDYIQARLSELTVSDAEVASFYAANKQEYARPARRQVALIEIALAENATEETRSKALQKAQKIQTQVAELDPKIMHFGALARQHSDDRASRYRGGVISWIIDHPARSYQWDTAVLSAAFALQQPGEVSDIITTAEGIYLVRLVRSEPASEQALEQLQDGIRNRMLQEKRKAEKSRLVAELQDGLTITVDQQVLAEIQPLSAPAKLLATSKPPALP